MNGLFGYGRKKINKLDCKLCLSEKKSWKNAYFNEISLNKVICSYFRQELDLQCLVYQKPNCLDCCEEELTEWFVECLLNMSISNIFNTFKNLPLSEKVEPHNIPQFSSINDAIIETPIVLEKASLPLSIVSLGLYLDNGHKKNQVAQRKYGENHAKLATLLDLATISSFSSPSMVSLSLLGKEYNKRNSKDKNLLASRLILRIPIIQSVLMKATKSMVNLEDEFFSLKESTKKRRLPNTRKLLDFLDSNFTATDNDLIEVMNNIRR